MTDIVKVQKTIATNEPSMTELALVYAKGRKYMVQQRLTHAVKQAMGDDLKAFFKADYRHSLGRWDIADRVKDREW